MNFDLSMSFLERLQASIRQHELGEAESNNAMEVAAQPHLRKISKFQNFSLQLLDDLDASTRYEYAFDGEGRMFPRPSSNKLASLMNEEQVHVVVGNSTKAVFIVAEDLLCFYSDFFARALKNGFLETTTKTVALPDDSVHSFEDLLVWMCIGKVPVAHPEDTRLNFVEDRKGLRPLLELYALGHKLIVEEIQPAVFAKLRQRIEIGDRWFTQPGLSPENLEMLLERSETGSEVRKAVTRWTADVLEARSETPEMYEASILEHPEFFIQVMKQWQKAADENHHFGIFGSPHKKAWRRIQ